MFRLSVEFENVAVLDGNIDLLADLEDGRGLEQDVGVELDAVRVDRIADDVAVRDLVPDGALDDDGLLFRLRPADPDDLRAEREAAALVNTVQITVVSRQEVRVPKQTSDRK